MLFPRATKQCHSLRKKPHRPFQDRNLTLWRQKQISERLSVPLQPQFYPNAFAKADRRSESKCRTVYTPYVTGAVRQTSPVLVYEADWPEPLLRNGHPASRLASVTFASPASQCRISERSSVRVTVSHLKLAVIGNVACQSHHGHQWEPRRCARCFRHWRNRSS
ncbi:hypothetical protein MHYP_G00187720 [Metynnis hypsauchen]